MNLPNYLTVGRIVLIPVFVFFFYLPFTWAHLAAAFIFMLAAMTDALDGFLARMLKQTSSFGAFLDPVADKLMVAVALILLVSKPYLPYISLPAAVIVGREIMISALREWMAEVGKRTSVAVSYIGKVKTLLQMGAVTLLLVCCAPEANQWIAALGYIALYASAILTLWSMMIYLRAAWPTLLKAQ